MLAAMIALEQLSVHAGDFRLRELSLVIPAGAYGVLMGKTGSGKTTLLEAILGLRAVDGGCIRLAGRDVTRLDPALRGIGFVPQDGALFDHLTVGEHLAFALRIRQLPRIEIDRRVGELAELLGIAALLSRRPAGLSGGERQRVALGRALSFQPRILCLDEPLSALDFETRRQMCELLRQVQRLTGVTALHVTHNLDEAELLADLLVRLEGGALAIQRRSGRSDSGGNPSAPSAAGVVAAPRGVLPVDAAPAVDAAPRPAAPRDRALGAGTTAFDSAEATPVREAPW